MVLSLYLCINDVIQNHIRTVYANENDMGNIAIIRDKSKLEGTCYIEIVPGEYRMKHWQKGSLFLDEEAFAFIEPIFEKYINGYDHYSMNDASKTEWLKIVKELMKFNELVRSATEFEDVVEEVGVIFGDTRDNFQTNFEENKKLLIQMNVELISWVKKVLKKHEHIAVLGL